ncbi:hypothetical protein N0V94_000696 [Neodidymelliopsis sp. IMI 364377]|nr:hypothetical protein N0V94_000696 [Neodidymelliopsis sp. IMI 364377]
MGSSQPPESPPTSPDSELHNYTALPQTPRFPRNPCPSAHHTLSLISSESSAQRLFGTSFTLRSPKTGEPFGPFTLLAYTDTLLYSYCAYIHKVLSTPLFTVRERELAVLAVASITQAQYVRAAHRRIARSAGLSDYAVEAALSGEELGHMLELSKRERSIYKLAAEMSRGWGRVSDETWRAVVEKEKPRSKGQEGWLEREDEGWEDIDGDGDKVVEGKEGKLTREEVAMLTQVVASAMFMSVLVNCADTATEVPGAGGVE